MQTGRLPTTLLVDLPNWVGDHMMAMPAVNRLVEGNRGGTTVLHTRPNLARFLSACFPEVDVVASPRKASPFSSAGLLRQARGRFEIGTTLRNSARGKILTRLVARWCAGSRGEGGSLLMNAACAVDRSVHQIHDADAILAAVGLDRADPDWRPSLPDELREEGRVEIRRIGLDRRRVVALAPTSARGEDKRWPVDGYGELARRLDGHGFEPLVVIGPGEEKMADAVCSAAGLALPVVGSNRDVAGLAVVLSGARALVGNDSGPMQLAALLGTPVVALFGTTDPARTGPRGDRHRIVTASAGSEEGIAGISVDQVEVAARDLL